MALSRTIFRQINFPFRPAVGLERDHTIFYRCAYLQCRHVQSQRDMKKDSRVVKPWHQLAERFENTLKRKYPKIHRVYVLFKQGTKDFLADSKQFYRVSKRLRSGEPLSKFSRAELELLLQLPGQAVKVVPMIILFVAPFGFYLVIPLAYFFPRQLLCRHYWTSEQRLQFASIDVKRRLGHCDSVLQHLDVGSQRLENNREENAVRALVQKLNSRGTPNLDEIVGARSAFQRKPLSLASMPWMNLLHLGRSVNLSVWRGRLHRSTLIMMAADRALSRESVDLLSNTELAQACATRGLNPVNLTKQQMTNYLKSWLAISLLLKDNETSLYLHTPTLIAKNHPNNVKLRKL